MVLRQELASEMQTTKTATSRLSKYRSAYFILTHKKLLL